MSQSSLVNVKVMTNHFGYPDGKKGRGGAKIDKIFVHHMAGTLTAEQCGNVFKSREASAHYGVDYKGRIGQYVLEENAAWHCGNKSYNLRSIGIELSNDGGASSGWHVSDKTIARCIDLIVDICKRNGIKKLKYTGDLKGNLCMHSWVASTSCPGPYLKKKFKYISEQVNKKLLASAPEQSIKLYRVRKSWTDAKSQVGAFADLNNAKKLADEKKLNVYDSKGKCVYQSVPKESTTYRVRKSWDNTKSQVGAYKILANAKKVADEKGLNVYDCTGKLVYQGKKEPTLVDKLLDACKTQAIWSKNSKYKWQKNPTIEKSKDYETCVTFAACVGQRVDLIPSQKYIWHDKTGKVVGATGNFEIIYPKNKKLKDLKDSLKAGDFVMDGDKTDLESGSHIFILTGEWKDGCPIVWDQHSAQGKGGKSYKYTRNRPVIAIARPKKK